MWGISYRYPLLDREVVETALQLPWQAFRSAGETPGDYDVKFASLAKPFGLNRMLPKQLMKNSQPGVCGE